MTTATAPAATIEQQIRERLMTPGDDGRSPYDRGSDAAGSILFDLYQAIDYTTQGPGGEPQDDEDSMWADLRPSQQQRLNDLIEGLYTVQDAAYERLVDAIVQAGETFAAECPDALRAEAS